MTLIPTGKQWAILKDGPLKGSDNVFVSETDNVAVLPNNLMSMKEELEFKAKLEEERMRIQTHHLVVPGARQELIASRTKKPESLHVYRRESWDSGADRPVFSYQKTIRPPQDRITLDEG